MSLTVPPIPPIPAMILAAGRGERMRPLTDTCPKPLLMVRGKPLMQWPLEALARGGFRQLVVNTAWLGEQIFARFANVFDLQPSPDMHGQLLNSEQPAGPDSQDAAAVATSPAAASVTIAYSHEGLDFGHALETAGGIVRALPLLGEVFWVLAGDVYVPDFEFSQDAVDRFRASGQLAHIWLVPNPAHNLKGDFGLSAGGRALNLAAGDATPRYTYSTIGLYRSALFAPPYCHIPPGNPDGVKAALAPLLRAAMDQGQVSAELYRGAWTDVGTPERLQWLNENSL